MDNAKAAPDSTAVRVALWRAMHVQIDSPPHILQDEIGLRLAAPDADWRKRRDMDPDATKLFRASIVARSRFVEDLVVEQAGRGISQYVILGAGLDTFAQRRPDIASRMQVYEVDRPGPQEWKRARLAALGFGVPAWLRFVPVDFEARDDWWERLKNAGFERERPAVAAELGVSMYLTKNVINETLRHAASLAPGSTFVMTYLLPMELAAPDERTAREMAERGARASGTPFVSFFSPDQILALAREAGFQEAQCVSAADLSQRYFAGRSDGLRLSGSEELLVACT